MSNTVKDCAKVPCAIGASLIFPTLGGVAGLATTVYPIMKVFNNDKLSGDALAAVAGLTLAAGASITAAGFFGGVMLAWLCKN